MAYERMARQPKSAKPEGMDRRRMVEMIGIEPMTFRLQSGRSTNWATSPYDFSTLEEDGPWWA